MENDKYAPGSPGIAPRWTTSSKEGIGTSITSESNVHFTLSHGILNEIYYPQTDTAAIRDMGLIITDGKKFFAEEKRHTKSKTKQIEPGIPAYQIVNECPEKRYKITKILVTDPSRNTMLQKIKFESKGEDEYKLHALLAPRLNNQGAGNSGWLGHYEDYPIIYAENGGKFLAMVCSKPWLRRSVGFVGESDGWQILNEDKWLSREYTEAYDGNIGLTGEIDISVGEVVIAIGFGNTHENAARAAIESIEEGFDFISEQYINDWRDWQDMLNELHEGRKSPGHLFRNSAAVLRTHSSKNYPGAMMASLSIPWGEIKGDDSVSGYHMVWPRDLVESAGGLLTLGAKEDAMKVLDYLVKTQKEDGSWSQNMWLSGDEFWDGIQLDETALPILLVDLCLKHEAIGKEDIDRYYEMVRNAVTFLLRKGLFTPQDRWEEQEGVSAHTSATIISALVAAAEFADRVGDSIGQYLRENADAWNEGLDYWLYVRSTRLTEEVGVDGYYLRTNPLRMKAADLGDRTMTVKNQPEGENIMPVVEMISVDPLALVRFGLRHPKDPRILNTIKVIDHTIMAETENGPCWYRYVNDGYGEHEDGTGYDGTGIGRPWPLLAAERAHYEVAKGNVGAAKKLLRAVEKFSNNGMIPEQIWDSEDILEKELFNGQHSGSAMPLAWAHSEHVKLVCSIKHKEVFDLPRCTYKRYVEDGVQSSHAIWRGDLRLAEMPAGRKLRIETVSPARVKWTTDGWDTEHQVETEDMGLGVHFTDLPVQELQEGQVIFTIFWTEEGQWDGEDYKVVIV
ncbi:glycoside hydrolase family 15 protein [Portibacter marinus]|uniref:glycoside hydrolase family 15 protein n=1 Tax=Portibacter marinus TaxID=2898660 RepID=UPI001F16C7E8|nr:glycoside hydrolase family 15 protein [Portibacter marinus]